MLKTFRTEPNRYGEMYLVVTFRSLVYVKIRRHVTYAYGVNINKFRNIKLLIYIEHSCTLIRAHIWNFIQIDSASPSAESQQGKFLNLTMREIVN